MRETPISNCEKKFILESLQQHQRLDGRKLSESRSMIISFGIDWGCVHVSLGNTRVIAQVSCELGQSQTIRPNEGILHINVELSPMAAAHFEAGRNSELTVRINRILERTFKDSKCVDLESLCVIAEDRVWILRVDVNVLNHDGNLIDCCAAACLCALAHFKRPDVTVDGNEVKIHTAAEKDFISIVLHHYPVCVSYATFNDGQIAVVDPSLIEEQICDAEMIFGINSYRELCCLNLSGKTLTSSSLFLKCANKAAEHAKATVELIKYEIDCDLESRKNNEAFGFAECLKYKKLNTVEEEKLSLKLRNFYYRMPYFSRNREVKMEVEDKTDIVDGEETAVKIEILDSSTGNISSNQKNINWFPDTDSDEDDIDMSRDLGAMISDGSDEDEKPLEQQLEAVNEKLCASKMSKPISKGTPVIKEEIGSDNSEEDETMILK
ncbi:uncharacterized protein LOC129605366 [Condylostylus longicornis]|uniref:uncharacterized protein LOC129605366 n=1 Tax=Condylostylus longicornis TaxID=2530218 RepID=UPI00244DFFBC|nr:uncharacterized protein LOC129605366 [Condylostylus longicornis]